MGQFDHNKAALLLEKHGNGVCVCFNKDSHYVIVLVTQEHLCFAMQLGKSTMPSIN